MSKVALAVVSGFVAALMLAQPASACTNLVAVTDNFGDTGHCGYDLETGEIWTLWQGNSPLMTSGYLDIIACSLTLEEGELTARMEVASPITAENGLPTGVKEIWFAWTFYVETGDEHFNEDYGLHVCWDGVEFYAFVADRTDFSNPPYPVVSIDDEDFDVSDNVIEVVIAADLVKGATMWMFESIVWMVYPVADDIMSQLAGTWYCADVTDWDGSTMLPLLPMPT